MSAPKRTCSSNWSKFAIAPRSPRSKRRVWSLPQATCNSSWSIWSSSSKRQPFLWTKTDSWFLPKRSKYAFLIAISMASNSLPLSFTACRRGYWTQRHSRWFKTGRPWTRLFWLLLTSWRRPGLWTREMCRDLSVTSLDCHSQICLRVTTLSWRTDYLTMQISLPGSKRTVWNYPQPNSSVAQTGT